jgi:hypothetical protein
MFQGLLYVGGSFTALADGTPAFYAATWDPVNSMWGSLPFNGFDSVVRAFCIFNSKLYIGGQFANFKGSNGVAKGIASYDGTTLAPVISTGAVNGLGSARVYTLCVYNSKLYAGGAFTNLGDGTTAAKNIAAFDGTAWTTLPCTSSVGVTGDVYALAEFSGNLILGGAFTTLGSGSAASRVAQWDGASLTAMGMGIGLNGANPGTVYALAAWNSKLWVGGQFTKLGDGATAADNIASYDGATWAVMPVGGGAASIGGAVWALAVAGSGIGRLYFAGGMFWGSPMLYYAGQYDGTTISKLQDGVSAETRSFALNADGTGVYVGGGGNMAKAQTSNAVLNNIGLFTISTQKWTGLQALTPKSTGIAAKPGGSTVRALAVYNNKLFISGSFDTLSDGTFMSHITTWDGTTLAAVTSSVAGGSVGGSYLGLGGPSNAMLAYNNILYVLFNGLTPVGTPWMSYIVSWDGLNWNKLVDTATGCGGVGAQSYALAAYGGKVVVGGSFTALFNTASTPAKYIAQWDPTAMTWRTLTSGSIIGLGGEVNALANFNGKLVIGGSFTTLSDASTSALRLATWDGTNYGTIAVGASNGVNGAVSVMAEFNSKLYIGGQFTKLGAAGATANRLCTYDGTDLAPVISLNSINGLGGNVFALAYIPSRNQLYIGGEFTALGDGTLATRLTAWDGSYFSVMPGLGTSGDKVSAISVYNGRVYAGGYFGATAGGLQAGHIVAIA